MGWMPKAMLLIFNTCIALRFVPLARYCLFLAVKRMALLDSITRQRMLAMASKPASHPQGFSPSK